MANRKPASTSASSHPPTVPKKYRPRPNPNHLTPKQKKEILAAWRKTKIERDYTDDRRWGAKRKLAAQFGVHPMTITTVVAEAESGANNPAADSRSGSYAAGWEDLSIKALAEDLEMNYGNLYAVLVGWRGKAKYSGERGRKPVVVGRVAKALGWTEEQVQERVERARKRRMEKARRRVRGLKRAA